MLSRKDMHAYQHRAVDFIKDNPKCALWLDMGLGKTISTLTALTDLIEQKKIKKTLIIAPLRVSNHTWPGEIAFWTHTSSMRYTVLSGLTPKKRKAALDEDTDIHIINRENIPWLVNQLGQTWSYDCVIIDESSSFKSHASKRWKSLRKVLGKIKRMVQLTGTPAPNSLIDLWPQFYLLDKGQRLENTRGKFLTKYCEAVGHPQWNQWSIKPDRADAIHKTVADIVLQMSAEDYIEMPDRIDISVSVSLPKKAREAYNSMRDDFMLEYDSGEILAANAAVKIGKLLQIANGNIYAEDGSYTLLHTAKLDALEDILEGLNEPALLAYSFKSDLKEMLIRFPQIKTIDRENNSLDAWNRGEIDVLCAHPASAGHGLNLAKGGRVIIWYGLPWSLELYQQFNARLHRQGQTQPVRVFHILADDTADAAVLQSLSRKTSAQDKLLQVIESHRKWTLST